MKKEEIQPKYQYAVKRVEVTTIEGVISATNFNEAMEKLQQSAVTRVQSVDRDVNFEIRPFSKLKN